MSVAPLPYAVPVDSAAAAAPQSSYRWLVCGLLFAGLTVNYVDRQILSLLKPMLDDQLHWTNSQFGNINAAFQFAYALSLLGFGWFVDRFGTKLGYSVSIVAWSLAAGAHALVGSIGGFLAARVALGLGEGGSFPSSIKAVALWFPQRERALATSLFNSGSNVGAILAPALVPLVALRFGWQACFLIAGAAGLAWVAFWLLLYRAPATSVLPVAALPAEEANTGGAESTLPQSVELEYHRPAAAPTPQPTLGRVLRHKQAWSFVVGKVLTDPVWWFFLIWLPDFFKKTRGLDVKSSWKHLCTIYAIVTVLSIVGGWAPRRLVQAGVSPSRARKGTMLVAALCALPILGVTHVGDWQAVLLIGLAGAAHQAWSANLYTTVSDLFPPSVVGGLVGFGSMVGAAASIGFPIVTGQLLDRFAASGNVTGGYALLFGLCGGAYVVAFGLCHLLAPRFEPVNLTADAA